MTDADDLPARSDAGGYIYIIEFSNGTVKVGSTTNPPERFATHRQHAEAFNIGVANHWISEEHPQYRKTEKALIALAEAMGGARARREYFHGISFRDLAAKAHAEIRVPKFQPQQPPTTEEFVDHLLNLIRNARLDADGELIHPLDEVSRKTHFSVTLLTRLCRSGEVKHTNQDGYVGLTNPQIRAMLAQYTVHAKGAPA